MAVRVSSGEDMSRLQEHEEPSDGQAPGVESLQQVPQDSPTSLWVLAGRAVQRALSFPSYLEAQIHRFDRRRRVYGFGLTWRCRVARHWWIDVENPDGGCCFSGVDIPGGRHICFYVKKRRCLDCGITEMLQLDAMGNPNKDEYYWSRWGDHQPLPKATALKENRP